MNYFDESIFLFNINLEDDDFDNNIDVDLFYEHIRDIILDAINNTIGEEGSSHVDKEVGKKSTLIMNLMSFHQRRYMMVIESIQFSIKTLISVGNLVWYFLILKIFRAALQQNEIKNKYDLY